MTIMDDPDLCGLYQQMVLIREFEESALQLASQGLVPGAIHPSTGQESVAVGALALRDPQEWVLGYYRCHGHALESGSAPEPLLREILGRGDGCRRRAGTSCSSPAPGRTGRGSRRRR